MNEDEKIRGNVEFISRATTFILVILINVICTILYVICAYKVLFPINVFDWVIFSFSTVGMLSVLTFLNVMALLILDRDQL